MRSNLLISRQRGGFTRKQLYQAATRFTPGTGLGVDELKERVNEYFRSDDAVSVWKAGRKVSLYASKTVAQQEKGKESKLGGIVAFVRHYAMKLSKNIKNIADRFLSQSRQQEKQKRREKMIPQRKNRETHANVTLKYSRYQGQRSKKRQQYERER